MVKIDHLGTETRNPKTNDLDLLSTAEVLSIMNEEDLNVVAGVKEALPQIEKVVCAAAETIQNGGRVIYIGAGTSGRTGLIDSVECGPTFGCTDEFMGVLAGGLPAVVKSAEGAEDSKELAVEDVKKINLTNKDLVIGIAASGRTPYPMGAMEYMHSIGGKTASISCNKNAELSKYADYPIEVSAGPEILTGSTRLKSGTCQKIICNMISTATMVKIGKVYKNLMIDVKATNLKLEARARKIVMEATGCDYDIADKVLNEVDNNCKLATVMIITGCSKQEAIERLETSKGLVRPALG